MSKGTKSISSFISQLLEKRGLNDQDEIDAFLNPDYEKHLHDSFLLDDMERAVGRILDAIERKEKVTIYADFDCDGIPAAVVLYDFFRKIGFKEYVDIYIPHRHNEGYGFHREAVEHIRSGGAKLIITVDVGINALEAAEYAKINDIDVIITDHHEMNGALPDAVAVINPKRGDYPFSDLCGAGVAYKLVQGLIAEGKKREISVFTEIPDGWEKWLLDMVGIATIADMVPLIDENRVLARYGLMVLRKTPRPGIAALCRKLRIEQKNITEDDIGFLIAPRINAASRMDESHLALKLLSTEDIIEAEEAVRQLEQLNRKRKGAVAALVREARKREKERVENANVYVTGSPEWKPSLLGLVANSLSDSRGGAVCVWGRDGRGILKGSCRSDGSVHVVDMFTSASHLLEEYGGHKHAGGFSVSHENVHKLSDVFNAAAKEQEYTPADECDTHDTVLPLSKVSWDTWKEISTLAPFGIGNAKPVLRFVDVRISGVRVFGKEGNHTELFLGGGSKDDVRAFKFFTSPDEFSCTPAPGMRATVVGTIEHDTFKGPNKVALRVINVAN